MLDIKSVIKSKGYTVTSLAEKMDIAQVSLSRIINGNPKVETLEKIATALDVDIRELFIPTKEEKQDFDFKCPNCGTELIVNKKK
ncbi:helix-turn-helix domain-containing protein [Draconibacterium sediminis]|uniref:HTH cro/C1-type domain-containing protein n=1 Tax=Draconibacterium sediminis TaxID=1544798 RepID=A0A0D8JC03_9BACT|nr:helix-turn-helix transcriptional regulator [Draconibacterium sediminis]KJF44056.1 hypothetical protein LH29_00510 [Draconibacterium sediminis]